MPSQFLSILTYPKRRTRMPLIKQPMHLPTSLIALVMKQTGDGRKGTVMRRKQMAECTWKHGPIFATVWRITKYKSLT
jgi:hypothetical protein